MILVQSELKEDILHALYKAVGLNTPGQGIAFTLPVSSAVGLFDPEKAQKPAKTAVKEIKLAAPAEEEKQGE